MWRIITDFSDYRVSDDGRVQSKKSGQWVDLVTKRGDKYHCVALYKDGGRFERQVHDLVLQEFVGPKPAGSEVCHGDGNLHNNSLSNLRYGDHHQNALDRRKHGTEPKPAGSKNTQAKLNEELVREILTTSSDVPHGVLAKQYGVSGSTICDIRNRRTWTHVLPHGQGFGG